MKKKLVITLLVFVACIFALQLNTFAVIISTDREVNSGSGEVTIVVTSNQSLGAYTLRLTDTAGLTLLSSSGGGEISSDKRTITNSSSTGITTLGSFTFQVPTVSSDTTYNVRFSITGMETTELASVPDESNTAVIRVKAPTPPVVDPEPEQPVNPQPEPPAQDPEPEQPSVPEQPSKSSDTSLKSLSVSPFGVINKASSGIYDITVENTLEKVTIKAVPNDNNATLVSGNGEVSLKEGLNSFKIVVRAEDGTEGTNTLVIRKKVAENNEPITPPNVIDENKNNEKPEEPEKPEDPEAPEENKDTELGLTNLVIAGIQLNPTFSKDVYEYKAEFSEDIDTLEILATPSVENAKVEITGNSNLKLGKNVITIIVKSEDDETTKNYQIEVTKNEPVVAATVNDNTVNSDSKNGEGPKGIVGKNVLIIIAVVAVAVLAGGIAFINKRMRDKEEEDYNDEEMYEEFSQEDAKNSIDEDESYRSLEKLSSIHNSNIFGNVGSTQDNQDEYDIYGNKKVAKEVKEEDIINTENNNFSNSFNNNYNDSFNNNFNNNYDDSFKNSSNNNYDDSFNNNFKNNFSNNFDDLNNDRQINNTKRRNIFGEEYDVMDKIDTILPNEVLTDNISSTNIGSTRSEDNFVSRDSSGLSKGRRFK